MTPPPTTVVMAVDLMSLIYAVIGMVVFIGGSWLFFGKMLIRQFNTGLKDSLKTLTERIDKVETKNDSLEKQFLTFLAQLPEKYVQREDWIRFSVSIDKKLDDLREVVGRAARSVAVLTERSKRSTPVETGED